MNRTILFIPAHAPGQGTGHIKRCVRLAAAFTAAGGQIFFLQQPGREAAALNTLAAGRWQILTDPGQCPAPDLVVVDNRETDKQTLVKWQFRAPVVGIDEGGKARDYLAFAIDTLPVPAFLQPPNIFALHRNPYPARKKSPGYPFKKVLISFGGEDKAGLTGKLLDMLLKKALFAPADLTVIQGPCFREAPQTAGITILKAPADLAALLPDYDLVFTHFGLTSFEAASADVPVILFNPSRYHRQLSRQCHMPEIGVGRPDLAKLVKLLTDRAFFQHRQAIVKQYFTGKEHDVPALLTRFSIKGNLHCPVCFTGLQKAVARFPERTYFTCSQCGIIYLACFSADNKLVYERIPGQVSEQVYNREYFFSQYQAQYGKTYLEDFDNIKNISGARVRELIRCAGAVQGKTLLDIGCAYGPFLQAIAEAGGIPYGVDIAEEAVQYVQEQLKFPALYADFEQAGSAAQIRTHFEAADGFDAVTMWYVVEHFTHLDTVLCAVNRLVKPGGIFALSTPNSAGISAAKNKRNFLQHSPVDHYTVLCPRVLKRLLLHYGFRVKRVRITGHHPERFPGMGNRHREGLLWKLVFLVSRLFRLGDTCEVYAGKVKELED